MGRGEDFFGGGEEGVIRFYVQRKGGSLIEAKSGDPNTKKFPGKHTLEPPKRFDQDLVFTPPFWLLQFLVLAHSWLPGNFSPPFRIISIHRLKLYSRTVKSGSKRVPTVFVHFNIKRFARYEFCIVFVSFKLH